MSRATVRSACKLWLDAPNVTGLLAVHSARPRNWKMSEIQFDATTPSSAAGFIHIESVDETRAANGKKVLSYIVALVFLFRTSRTDAGLAIDDYDALVDRIKARLRDHTGGVVLGGTQPAIFNAGENLLTDETDLPPDKPLLSDSWARVRWDVLEMINA